MTRCVVAVTLGAGFSHGFSACTYVGTVTKDGLLRVRANHAHVAMGVVGCVRWG